MTGYERADVGTARLAWTAHGPADGRPVLLIHAGIADRSMYGPLLEVLPAGVRAVAYDQRGFGNSTWRTASWSHLDDLLALLDRLGWDRATLVGSSFGAYVALEAAVAAPSRVAGLVLLAPPAFDWDWSAPMEAYREADEAALTDGRFEDAVAQDLAMWVDGPHRGPDAVDPALREGVARGMRHFLQAQKRVPLGEEAELEPPAFERLREVRADTVIAVGDADVEDFQRIAVRYVSRLPRATLHRVEGAGHLLALERPDVVARLIAGAVPAA